MIGAVTLTACGGLIVGGVVTMLVGRTAGLVGRTAGDEALSVRFRCGSCKARLVLCETIPLLSWVVLRGRCRYCANRISVMYPAVESATSVLWVVVFLRFGWSWHLLPPLLLVTALTALSVVDLYSYRLPDRLVFSALGLSLSAMLTTGLAAGDLSPVGFGVLGMFAYFGLMLVVHLISPRGLGFGDVKLSLLLGLNLGWAAGIMQGGLLLVLRLVFWTQFMASILGLIGGLSLGVARKKLKRSVLADPQADAEQPAGLLAQSFPFGPALACATMAVVLFVESFPGA